MNDALIWKGPNWLSDLSVFKAPANLETGFMLALQSQGKREAHESLALRSQGNKLQGFLNLGAMPGLQLKCHSIQEK